MLANRLSQRWWALIAILLLVAVLAPIARAFMTRDFPQGHDATAHLTYTFRFDRAFAQHQWPVRWVEGLQPGRGQPVFNFYQVGFYYLVELVHRCGVKLSVAYKATPVLLWWMASVFMFLLLRPYGPFPAVAGATAFALSPYTIIDVFIRAAYPEFTALAFGVATLWAADRFLRSGRRWYLLAVPPLLAMMLIAHLPGSLILSTMFVAHVCAMLIADRDARRRVPWLFAAAIIGVGLAGFYVVPALFELPLINIRSLTQGHADYHQHFLAPAQLFRVYWGDEWNYHGTSVTNPDDLMPFHISAVQWLGLAGAIVVMLWGTVTRTFTRATWLSIAWLLVAAVCVFMTNARSLHVWESVASLAFLQFPWRFFLLMSVAGGVLVALTLSRIERPAVLVTTVVVIVASQAYLYVPRLHPASYLKRMDMDIDQATWPLTNGAHQLGFDEPAYDPIGTEPVSDVSGRWVVKSGRPYARELAIADDHISLELLSDSDTRLRLNSRMFPGWHVRINGIETRVTTVPGSGFMDLTVPAGAHVVDARFENTGTRAVANVTTEASAVLCVLLVAVYRPARRRVVEPVAA